MNAFFLIFVLASSPTSTTVEQDGVQIEVSVDSHVYEWKISNHSAAPINHFEIYQAGCYNHQVPDGWKWTYEKGRFIASAELESAVIPPGTTRLFSARVSASGAVLGETSAVIGFVHDREHIKIPSIWAPTARPSSILVLIPVMIIVLASVHALFVMRKQRTIPRSEGV